MMIATLLFALSIGAVSPESATIVGVVEFEGRPVPGVTVTLKTADRGVKTVISNDHGSFAFRNIREGTHDVAFELQGFESVTQSITAQRAGNVAGVVSLHRALIDEPITIACGPFHCGNEPPTPYGVPLCSEYDLHSSLGDAVKAHDSSALDLLRATYETTVSIQERHRVGGMLLGHVSDDSLYWKELLRFAEDAVRFGEERDEVRAEFEAYCAERGYEVNGYSDVMWNALWIASTDSRSRPLLLRALESEDSNLLCAAICGLAVQRDLSTLDEIEKALEHRAGANGLLFCLVGFESDAADALALKYAKNDDERKFYLESRSAVSSSEP